MRPIVFPPLTAGAQAGVSPSQGRSRVPTARRPSSRHQQWALTCPPSPWTLRTSCGEGGASGASACLLLSGPDLCRRPGAHRRLGCSAGNSHGGRKGACKVFQAARPV